MNWILALITLAVSYYTCTYGMWAWRKGNRAGGVGLFALAAVTFIVSIYAIFVRTGF